MESNFLNLMAYAMDFNSRKTGKVSHQCQSDIPHDIFYQSCLLPATVLTLLMAFTKRRKNILPGFFNGRPGLLHPIDTTSSLSSVSYCCASGVTVSLVYKIVMEQKLAFIYKGPAEFQTLIALVSMFIYGMVFYPVFACLALRTAFSFALGSIYVWMFLIVALYQLSECDYSTYQRTVHVARALPYLVCLGYLSLSLPIRFWIAFRSRELVRHSTLEHQSGETLEEIQQSFQGIHVRSILKKAIIHTESPLSLMRKIKAIRGMINRPDKGFKYPTSLISVMFIGTCVVYTISVEILASVITMTNLNLDNINAEIKGCANISRENISCTSVVTNLRYIFNAVYALNLCIIVSVVAAGILTVINIIDMMSTYRTNIFAMYKGDYSIIPPPSQSSAVSLCLGSIEFPGFQVAFIIWGYVLQLIVFLIIFVIIALLIFILQAGILNWVAAMAKQMWPTLLIVILLIASHTLLVKYVFLQKPGKYLLLDNRRFLFIYTFFMFFFDIFIGFFSCFSRIIKIAAIGSLNMSRLDNSTFPRQFESLDPGFGAYHGYIHMQAAHTHPVVNVFVRLLVSIIQSKKDNRSKSGKRMLCFKSGEVNEGDNAFEIFTDPQYLFEHGVRRCLVSARFNWLVAYTLLHNPSVRIHRRGVWQALDLARKRGLKIPISDKPLTDFDLVKLQHQREG